MNVASDPAQRESRRPRWQIRAALLLAVVAVGTYLLTHSRAPQHTLTLPVVARTNLLFQSDRWFLPSSTDAFTGWMVEAYPDGALLSRTAVSNGLLNGVSEGFYTNGQIQIREYYKDSLADGLRQRWYENGQIKSEAIIVAGKLEGAFRSWHENGQLAEQIEMKQGNPDGQAWAYYPSGCVKAETLMDEGKVLNRKFWEDGQHRQASASNGPPAGQAN